MVEFKLFLYIIIIFSAVFHEFFHAWMANVLGDPTAKHAGRLTLNPLKHIDLMGTVIIPLFLLFFVGGFIGWAKPVPYNPHNLRDQKWGSTKVAFAGPGANFLLALIFALIFRFLPIGEAFHVAISWIIYINIFLGLFNLIPIPPLDGSKLIMDLFPQQSRQFMRMGFMGIFLALFVAIMILPPIAQFVYRILAGAPFVPYVF
jgi:Zn-dependent protease